MHQGAAARRGPLQQLRFGSGRRLRRPRQFSLRRGAVRRTALVLLTLLSVACSRDAGDDGRLVELPLEPEPAGSVEDIEDFEPTPVPSEVLAEEFDPIEGVRAISFLSADETRLAGYLFGDDEQRERGVLLLHNSSTNMAEWYPLAERLMNDGYAALVFDFRGYGQSAGDRDPAKYPSDVSGALDILYVNGVERFAVVGAEVGGTAAIAGSAAWTQPVDALVTFDSDPKFESLDATQAARAFPSPALVIDEDESSELGGMIPEAETYASSESPLRSDSGATIERIVSFLEEELS